MKKDEKRRKTAKAAKNGRKTAKAAKIDEKRQKTLEKRRNGKKLWKTAKIILGAASKFFLALEGGGGLNQSSQPPIFWTDIQVKSEKNLSDSKIWEKSEWLKKRVFAT